MRSHIKLSWIALLAMLVGIVGLAGLGAKDPEQKPEKAADEAKAVKPKPLSDNVKKGLAYLVSQQHESGGWGQGGGWRQAVQGGGGRVEGKDVKDPPDVANTCIATLALLRAGNTANQGEYAKNVAKALDFLFTKVEKADKESLYVTDIRNTQVQSKIGPYADTFLTALVLAEMKGKMPDEKGEKRLITALDKTVNKIEINQKADGTFAGNQGWATVLSQGLASKGLDRAAQVGATVSPKALAKDQKQAVAGLDTKTGEFLPATTATKPTVAGDPRLAGPAGIRTGPAGIRSAEFGRGAAEASSSPGDAGVPIYSSSGKAAGLQEAVTTLKKGEKENRRIIADKSASKEAKARAKDGLERLDRAEEESDAAVRGLTAKLDNKQFIQGFGNNGGEEFLSYMNISETLLAKGGAEWEKWDKKMAEGLYKAQDKDGGWSGQHCITGRTFCTSTALLVLMADRANVPVAAKMKGGK